MSSIQSVTYEEAVAVTASDTVADPGGPFAGFHTGLGGAIKVTTIRNQDVAFTAVAAGIIMPIAITRVWSAGTDHPTTIVGLRANPYRQIVNPGTGTVL